MTGWVRGAAGGALSLLGAFALYQATCAAWSEASSFRPRRGRVPVPRELAGLASVRDVSFPARSGTIRGWLLPSRNGAAVVLVHGSDCNRACVAAEARRLADAGFGALLFDWPGRGESDGRVTFGRNELSAIRAAIEFIRAQPDTDPDRVGALGVSAGASLLVMEAARDASVRALVLVSPFADSDAQTRSEFATWGPLTQWPALLVDRLLMPDGPVRVVEFARALRRTAFLVVAGDRDPVVPLSASEEVYRAAPEPKKLLILPSAHHADFGALEPGAYGEQIVAWFQAGLAGVSVSPSP